MTDAELQTLAAKAAALPDGRNELSPKSLCSVTAQALVDPQGHIRVYHSGNDEVVTIKRVDGNPIVAANNVATLKSALQLVLSEAGIATFG